MPGPITVVCIWFHKAAPVKELAEYFLRFSPQISVREERALFVEIGKCKKLYSENTFLARTAVILKRTSQEASVAIGQDITDSLCFAKFGKTTVDELPLVALIDFVDPFGRDDVLRKAILKMVSTFSDLGIKTLKDFKKIPVGNLIERYGVVGRFAHQRVSMSDFISWPLWQPEEVISEKKDFASCEFYGELEPILFEMKGQLDRIFSRLYARNKKAMALKVQIQCEKFSTTPKPMRIFNFQFFAPQGSTFGTLKILRERLAKDFEKEPVRSPIQSVQITVLKTVSFTGGQKNVFDNTEEQIEQIHSLHNQLIEMIGKENIYQAELTEDRRPERSWRKVYGTPHLAQQNAPELKGVIPERATYLCRYPIKIEVTAGFVYIKKKRYRILQWHKNIERITGGWFEKPEAEIKNTYDRNYYQVELEDHQKVSIFETPTREFFLHGYYG